MPVSTKDIQHWIDRATELGAAGAEVLVTERKGVYLRVEQGRITAQKPIDEATVRVTAFVEGGGMGQAVTVPSDAGSAVASAVAAAHDAPSDAHAGPVRGMRPLDYNELGIDDRRWEQLTDADRFDVVIAAERGAREDARVHTQPFTYTDARTRRVFASTADVLWEEFSTRYTCEGGIRVKGEDAVIALTDGIDARSFATVSSIPFGLNMARRALALLDNRTKVEGPIRVMLAPRAAAALFDGLGRALASKAPTFFDDGTAVNPAIHLLDDGRLPGGLRSAAFDDRGVPPVPVVVLREGRLDQRYTPPATARDRDARPTGHMWDGSLRPGNLILRGGTRSYNAVLSSLSDILTLVVEDLAGVENIDWKTGEADLVAYGVLRRGNEELGSVPGVRLRGNMEDVLTQLVDVSSDTDRIGHIDASGMLVDGFTAG